MWHQRLLLFIVPLVIIIAGVYINHGNIFTEYKRFSNATTIPDTLSKTGRTGNELRILEYRSHSDARLEKFSIDLTPENMPSSTVVNKIAAQSFLPTLSVVIDSDDITGEYGGLIKNSMERGRSWERPAYASYFDEGRMRFATGAGIRVHGGKSRTMQEKSYRLYFRQMYGNPFISDDDLFSGEANPIRSLVVHNDKRANRKTTWHYVNPIAYQLARDIGCITALTQPIQFYINGINQGPYVLTEHISEDYVRAHFGHTDFTVVEMKLDQDTMSSRTKLGNGKSYEQLEKWLNEAPTPLGMADVSSRVDLDNLTNWIISIVYGGVTDAFQGVAMLDETEIGGRWFWINWDMDHAFSDRYKQAREPWMMDSFSGLSGVLTSSDIRSVILRRLRNESSEYRHYFISRVVEVLNHVLSREKVTETVTYYRRVAADHGIADLSNFDKIQVFVGNRPAILRQHLDTYFDAGTSYTLTLSNPDKIKIKVDGYEMSNDYVGWYFIDTPAVVEIQESVQHAGAKLTLNGEPLFNTGRKVKISLTGDTHLVIRRLN